MLNFPLPTLGGMQFWADERVYSRWRIQRHIITGRCRLLDPGNVRRARGSYEACDAQLQAFRAAGKIARPSTETVILLHGLWRTRRSMRKIEKALRAAGYDAIAISYPSTKARIEEHAERLARLISRMDDSERISFVGHSMGGMIVRRYLQNHHDPRIGRLVMIAPPNQGSGMAGLLQRRRLLRLFFGPASLQMIPGGEATRLAVPWAPFGVIAGGKGTAAGYNPLLEGDNDGVVEVECAKLQGMADFLLVPSAHTFIMNNRRTIEAVTDFLATGQFRPDK